MGMLECARSMVGGDQCLVGGRVGRLGEREDSEVGREGGREGGIPKCRFSEACSDSQLGMGRDAAPFLSAASRSISV